MSTIHYRLRVRNADDSADLLVISSKPGDPNPYLEGPPDADGASLDPLGGNVDVGGSTWRAIDAAVAGIRLVTGAMVDAESRFQLLGRKAIGEEALDGGPWAEFTNGFVVGIRFPSALVAEFQIDDAQRVETSGEVWGRASAHFDNYGCIVGGPLREKFGRVAAGVPWRMQVTDVTATYVRLAYVRGPAAPFAARSRRYFVASDKWRTGVATTDSAGSFPGLTARVETTAGALEGQFTPIAAPRVTIASGSGEEYVFDDLLIGSELAFRLDWTTDQPTVGEQFNVFVFPNETSEPSNPLHIVGHPVDIVADVMSDIGQPYDAASHLAVRAAIGASRRVLLRPTRAYTPAEVKQALGGLFGFALRPGPDGAMEFFTTRIRDAAAPSVTVDVNDMRSADGMIFDLDEASIINRVMVEQERFVLWRPEDGGEEPVDGLLAISQSVTRPYATDQVDREVSFAIPGQVAFAVTIPLIGETVIPVDLEKFVIALADGEIFPRFAHGAPTSELELLRGADVALGDLLVLDVPHLPNNGVRGGERIVQVTQVTKTPAGPRIVVQDAGENAQAATTPTFTLAASATEPQKRVVLTLTNAAALVADAAKVRLEWDATSATTPTGAGALLGVIDPAVETTFTTPSVDAGALVWIRARAEVPDRRPSAYSSWASVDLADLVAPSAISRTGNAFEWTPGESGAWTYVYWRPASETEDRIAVFLPPGSDRVSLDGVVPASTSVVVSIRHQELPPYAGRTAALTSSYTTAAATTLATPLAPSVFTGNPFRIDLGGPFSIPGLGAGEKDGYFGLLVTADPASLPCSIVFEEAVETAAGSNAYGSYVASQPVSAKAGEPTRWFSYAANDGRRRRLRAKATRQGALDSAYTTPLGVLPWGTVTVPRLQVPDRPLWVNAGQGIKVGTAAAPGTITKTMRFHAAQFLPASSTATWTLNEQYLTGGAQNFYCGSVLPEGATIVAISMMVKKPSGETCAIELHQANAPGGLNLSVGTISAATLNAFQENSTAGLSHVVARGSVAYCWELQLSSGASLAWAQITYTVANYETAL